MLDKPLGMPAGSVRAIIAIIAILAAVIYAGFVIYAKTVRGVEIELPAFILPILGTTIGYYFGIRSSDPPTPVDKSANPSVDNTPAAKYIPPTPIETEPPETLAG